MNLTSHQGPIYVKVRNRLIDLFSYFRQSIWQSFAKRT